MNRSLGKRVSFTIDLDELSADTQFAPQRATVESPANLSGFVVCPMGPFMCRTPEPWFWQQQMIYRIAWAQAIKSAPPTIELFTVSLSPDACN